MLFKRIPTPSIHPKLWLYLMCCPSLDLNLRFLPRSGGLLDQDYSDVFYFSIIEKKLKELVSAESKK